MITPRVVRTSMMGFIGGLLIGLCLAYPVSAYADSAAVDLDEHRKLNALEQTADELYQFVLKGELEQALLRVQLMTKQLSEIQLLQYTSVEGVNAFFDTLLELQRALVAMKQDQKASEASAAKLRMAVDALQSQGEPMWRQYYKPLKEALRDLEEQVKTDQMAAINKLQAQLVDQYKMVRPAILISLDASQVSMFDSLLTSIATSLSNQHKEQAIQLIQRTQATLAEIFDVEADKTAFLPVPGPRETLYWSVLLGSLIAVVLAYVALQKFRYDHGIVSMKDKKQQEPFIKK